MAKGGKSKGMLSHQQGQKKLDKKEISKKEKSQSDLKKDEPTVVTEDHLKAAGKNKLNSDKKDEGNTEETGSQALSKKDKRKLKKQTKKEQEKKQKNDSEAAEASVNEDEGEENDEEEDEDEDEDEKSLDLERLAQSESEEDDEDEDEDEDENEDEESDDVNEEGEGKEQDEEEEAEDVPLSDVEFDSDADVVPHQRLTMNNTNALKQSLERIRLPWSKTSFEEHVSVTSKANTDEGIKDIYDDTERELAFYKQSLEGVNYAREQLNKLRIPFKRPLDYFAEMVKSDEHMDKIKGKLVQEVSEKKARQDARRQRDLKKFGKQVQVATLQKRQLEKKDTLEKIKALKQKRKHSEIGEDEFNIGVEEATGETESKKPKVNHKREGKNKKYGQGGMKRFKRKNDAASSSEMTGFSHRKMKGRPGRSRRQKKH